MTPARMAAIHAASFSHPRPWSETEFAGLAADPAAFLIAEGDHGLIVGRVVLDEAELLTLAVDSAHRRQGIGARLLAGFEAEARARGAGCAFLEVASDNPAAIALYGRGGWARVGLRRGYYGAGIDAVVMQRMIAGTSQRGGIPGE